MLDKDEIRVKVQAILNKAHSNKHKRILKEDERGLVFADPITGDSTKNPYTKRCHLYWNSFYVVSYDNEGYKIPFTKFCDMFNIELNPEERIAIYDQIDKNITYDDYEEEIISSKFEDLIDLEELMEYTRSPENTLNIINLQEVKYNSRVYKYLKSRNLDGDRNIYQAEHYPHPDWKEDIMVILNKKGDKVIGAQIRNLKHGKKRLFKIYNFESILAEMDKDGLEKMDMNKIVLYNKLSYLFNIFSVNFNKKVTIFEGYTDSVFFPNSIGVTGASTDLSLLEKNDLDLRYFYDNDFTGHKKSLSKIDKYPVFLWNKLFEKLSEIKKVKDPYSYLNKISKVKDLNELSQIVNNPYKQLKLEEFFSVDMYDKKYIPNIKIKRKYERFKKKV